MIIVHTININKIKEKKGLLLELWYLFIFINIVMK